MSLSRLHNDINVIHPPGSLSGVVVVVWWCGWWWGWGGGSQQRAGWHGGFGQVDGWQCWRLWTRPISRVYSLPYCGDATSSHTPPHSNKFSLLNSHSSHRVSGGILGCTRRRTHPVTAVSTSIWGTSRAANRHTRTLQRAAPLVRQPAIRILPAAANRKQTPTTDRSSWATTGSSRGRQVRGTTDPSLHMLLLTIPLAFASLTFYVHTIDCNLTPWEVVCTCAPHTQPHSATCQSRLVVHTIDCNLTPWEVVCTCAPHTQPHSATCQSRLVVHSTIAHDTLTFPSLASHLRTGHVCRSTSALATGGDSVPDLTVNHTNSATLISAAAREFISRVATPNETTPWFLYLPFQNVHAPCKQAEP
jgi:hypothetical protein